MQDTTFHVLGDGFEPFPVVPCHIMLPSVEDFHTGVGYFFELLGLRLLHILPDVLCDFFALFFGVAHFRLVIIRNARSRIR